MKRIFSIPVLSLIAGALLVACASNHGSPWTNNSPANNKQTQEPREFPGTAWRKAKTPEERVLVD